ncbi:hypothetical protein ON010_g8751 [Phytophthora cinnamomi]|nr:hypothetical protein ON010_g8751 [Phytophthora cinnamomi]
MDDAHGPGGATWSSSDESEVDEVHDTRATGHGAAQAYGSAQPLAPGRRQLWHQRQTTGPPPPATRMSSRVRTPNVRLRDYQLMVEEKFVGDPATVKEALSSPQRDEWWAAMQSEYDALLRNNTWKLIDPPKSSPGHPIKNLTSKWVLRVKRDEHGKILPYKARLVIHGFKQRYGVGYSKTYAAVVRVITILLVLLIALILKLNARHVDFDTAFLNTVLKKFVILMQQPDFFEDGTGPVCWLLKGLYGLIQAARLWYQMLHKPLVKIGFNRSTFDVGLYYKYIDGRITLITVYVDDIIIVGKPHDIDQVIADLMVEYSLKDLGRVCHFLGMEVHYEPGELLCISQTAYIDKILHRFHMTEARTVRSPQMMNEKDQAIETDETKSE